MWLACSVVAVEVGADFKFSIGSTDVFLFYFESAFAGGRTILNLQEVELFTFTKFPKLSKLPFQQNSTKFANPQANRKISKANRKIFAGESKIFESKSKNFEKIGLDWLAVVLAIENIFKTFYYSDRILNRKEKRNNWHRVVKVLKTSAKF